MDPREHQTLEESNSSHSQQVHRQEDGAVHFWRMKENLQNIPELY